MKTFKYLCLFGLLTATSIFAQEEICSRTRSQTDSELRNPSNRIGFKNAGGLFNSGVCWWHSRLQRSSVYLTQFAPNLPRPSTDELYQILYGLRNMSDVVTIPGFSNFQSFTQAYKAETQWILDQWQRFDGFRNSQWIRGISGRSSLESMQMQAQMQLVYKYFQESPTPIWLMAQIKGISSHSFLLLGMTRVEEGFDLEVLDSNYPLITGVVHYKFGDTSLREVGTKYTFVPYVGFQNDFKLISATLKEHCLNKDELNVTGIKPGQIEASKN